MVGELTNEIVEAFRGRDDVTGLFVEMSDELVELGDEALELLFAPSESAGECGGDKPGAECASSDFVVGL